MIKYPVTLQLRALEKLNVCKHLWQEPLGQAIIASCLSADLKEHTLRSFSKNIKFNLPELTDYNLIEIF